MKKKIYILILSERFPTWHSKAGTPTKFKGSFLSRKKSHTIRSNLPLWEKRIKEVQEGRAVLSIRQWTGKPYRSQQEEIEILTNDSGIGVQRLVSDRHGNYFVGEEKRQISPCIIANNDGLSVEDWSEWFDGNSPDELAIIHFGDFRY